VRKHRTGLGWIPDDRGKYEGLDVAPCDVGDAVSNLYGTLLPTADISSLLP